MLLHKLYNGVSCFYLLELSFKIFIKKKKNNQIFTNSNKFEHFGPNTHYFLKCVFFFCSLSGAQCLIVTTWFELIVPAVAIQLILMHKSLVFFI